jgi:hypothetical protein
LTPLILNEVGAFAFWARDSDFDWDAAGKAFDVTADETAPSKRFHFFEFSDDPKRVSGALADHVKSGAKAF